MVKVLFVCMGNICRSPTAQGVFSSLVKGAGLDGQIEIDSAGTHSYHIGKGPDERAQRSARKRGIDLSLLRARRVAKKDFETFDYVLAMDRDNYQLLQDLCAPRYRTRLRMFLDYAPHLAVREVPDPYYGGANGFEQVLDMIEAASRGLLEDIRKHRL